ncbi:uncharacterized protein cubi_02724 [Cryptosporidium ubiquitum]|uniref:Uncharacterized protein n=1 Tax=Cryptosporidium ubiquitum TaxID=857276 RepID=A0A1J4MI37_9CRYT|nr:uncharacterized protein cubi_02724 [Cryptosporidium ubiquitum]OII73922.1 hypothetical protein cubi_02724 [Cryptosporidium ubiquitum]
MASLSEILVLVENKGGKEDIEIELNANLPEAELNKLREQLFMIGFELQSQNFGEDKGSSDSDCKNNQGRKLVLKKQSYNELVVKEVSNMSTQNQQEIPNTQTPKSALKNKKDNFIDKSQKLDEELAAIRAEKAKQYKGSTSHSSRNANNTCNSNNNNRNSSDSQSSFRRFMNFDWFTSMFSSRRRGTSQRDRMYLDSSYYRSKNTGCCGSSCGGS